MDQFLRESVGDGVAMFALFDAVFARPVEWFGAGVDDGFVGEDAACGGEEESEGEELHFLSFVVSLCGKVCSKLYGDLCCLWFGLTLMGRK